MYEAAIQKPLKNALFGRYVLLSLSLFVHQCTKHTVPRMTFLQSGSADLHTRYRNWDQEMSFISE
jgi:hypothetical protein